MDIHYRMKQSAAITVGGPVLGLLLLLWLVTGCAQSRPLLYEVYLEPHITISPDADGVEDVTVLHYALDQPAWVTIAFESGDGQRHIWRERERRAADQYEGGFGGVVNGRMLPDGQYRVVITAEPIKGGESSTLTVPLTIANAETVAPEVFNLDVTPRLLTPNRDGISDEAAITYSLSKEMERVEVYLLGPDGIRYPVPQDEIRDATAEGSHLHRWDGGVGLGAVPPPDGEYTLVVEAYDRPGASDVVSATLRLENGGLPLAQITRHDVEFSTATLAISDTLTFTTTVTNVGEAPIRTHGPEPGTVYDSTTNYNNFGEPISDGAWRLGLDFEGNRVYNGQRYPYRWQLGQTDELTEIEGELYLMPGQTVTITGGLRLLEMPPRVAPGFWIGLVHENVRFVEDFVGTEYITIEVDRDLPTTLGTPAPAP
jgi:hypothetical protein